MNRKTMRVAASLFAAILVFMTPAAAVEVSARSAVLLDGDTGEILWEKNARERSLIASTTKIMTALVALEGAELDAVVEVPPEAVGVEGSSMYLKAGEQLTVRELLYGLMLSSGNDAAVALAIHTAGDVPSFVARMNEKAAALGLTDIHFANPHGLDDEGNYATAESLGRLAAAAMENPDFREIVSAKSYQAGNRWLKNHNKLLWQYPGAAGVKTGFTKKAGRILVGAAERDGRRLISVTINAPSDWADHAAMLDHGFSLYQRRTLVTAEEVVGSIPVISGTAGTVALTAGETVEYAMLPGETAELRLLTRPFVYAPVEAGAPLGTLQVYVGGKLAGQTPVYAAEAAPLEPERPSRWQRFRENFA